MSVPSEEGFKKTALNYEKQYQSSKTLSLAILSAYFDRPSSGNEVQLFPKAQEICFLL